MCNAASCWERRLLLHSGMQRVAKGRSCQSEGLRESGVLGRRAMSPLLPASLYEEGTNGRSSGTFPAFWAHQIVEFHMPFIYSRATKRLAYFMSKLCILKD